MLQTPLALALGAALGFAQAAPAPMLVTTSELAAMLSDPDVAIVHVAESASAFEEGHIPGARLLAHGAFAVSGGGLGAELPPLDQLARALEAAGIRDSSRIVLYGGSPVAAARAFFTLDVLGHPRVALLDGGLRAWRAEQRPVATGPAQPPVRRGTFTPRLNESRLATAAFIRDRLQPGSGRGIALLDVRPDAEFLGTGSGHRGAHSAGHIPGARQLPWEALVGPDGRFLPRAPLDARLRSAGAAKDRPVIAYCMVGMRASVAYFAARLLGYDARLYDGSIVDWSRRGLPVTTGRP